MEIDPKQISSIVSSAGVAGVLLWILARVVMRVADRMIAAIDKVGEKIDRHTENESAHVGELAKELAALRGHLGMEAVPVRRPTPPVGVRAETGGER